MQTRIINQIVVLIKTQIMTTYNYNSELIKAMNEKLPNGTNLANTLIDMLYLGKEAVYRRLRGEVPFTLAEAAAISQKMGVSLDKLAGTNVDSNAIFDLNIIRQSRSVGDLLLYRG